MVGVCFEINGTLKLKKDIQKCKDTLDALCSGTKNESLNISDSDMEVKKRNVGGSEENSKPEDQISQAQSELAELQQKLQYESVDPSDMELLHYAFNYCGIMTGNFN